MYCGGSPKCLENTALDALSGGLRSFLRSYSNNTFHKHVIDFTYYIHSTNADYIHLTNIYFLLFYVSRIFQIPLPSRSLYALCWGYISKIDYLRNFWKTQFFQIWKTQQQPQDWKRSVFTPVPKKGNAKECSNYRTIALTSHTSKVIPSSKFSKAAFNSMWTMNFQMFQMDLEKAKEPEIKLSTSIGSSKKYESSRKTSTSA